MRKTDDLSCQLFEKVEAGGLQTTCMDGLALDRRRDFFRPKTSRREGNMGLHLVKIQPSPRIMDI